jgi:hypothetical protein
MPAAALERKYLLSDVDEPIYPLENGHYRIYAPSPSNLCGDSKGPAPCPVDPLIVQNKFEESHIVHSPTKVETKKPTGILVLCPLTH